MPNSSDKCDNLVAFFRSLTWYWRRTASLASPFVTAPMSETFVEGRIPTKTKSKRPTCSSSNWATFTIGYSSSLHAVHNEARKRLGVVRFSPCIHTKPSDL